MCLSREASLLGRKEVLTGKAKFGIFGDGKEMAQVALAKVVQPGDWRSGYYRDQTLMMAKGLLSVQQYFAALYAHADVAADPTSGGRQMGGHFATRTLEDDGSWKDLMAGFNSSPDVSPTGAQMPRLVGLAQASKVFRALPELASSMETFTSGGNEIAIGTIGDASTSEGMFWESMNAACVLEVPMLMSVWDDGYGISVPKKYQTVKESISTALSGFQREEATNGLVIYRVKGWDYPSLVATYEEAAKRCREDHVPVLVHVEEVTQPQGHSTSGSHERYKSEERLAWAKEFDCIQKMSEFLIREGAATEDELQALRKEAKKTFGHSKRRRGLPSVPRSTRNASPPAMCFSRWTLPGPMRSATTPTRAAPKSRKRSGKRLSTLQETGRQRAPTSRGGCRRSRRTTSSGTTPTSTVKATTTPWTWSLCPPRTTRTLKCSTAVKCFSGILT